MRSPKNCVFPEGLTHAFGQKMVLFSYLLSVKKGLEIRFNDVQDRKKPFFSL